MSVAGDFERHKPWVTKFWVDGAAYGGWYDAAADPRLAIFRRQFPDARHVLELGSLEGGHSLAIAGWPGIESVVAVEGRRGNLARARFVQGLTGRTNVTFTHGSLETLDLAALGRFDVVLCMGLLYHLPEPWSLLERVASAADALFLWTHYAPEAGVRAKRRGYEGRIYHEWRFLYEPLSGLSFRSFWPTRTALIRMLGDCGLPQVTVLEDQPEHEHGPAILLSARR
jgi:SAM-dependent methyltransferase